MARTKKTAPAETAKAVTKKVTYTLTVPLLKRIGHEAVDTDANVSDLVEALLTEALDARAVAK
jgi:hypothetical protein